MTVTNETSVRRGPESWAYIYTGLGFVVTIESTIIGMMTPLMFPWNIIIYLPSRQLPFGSSSTTNGFTTC